MEIRVVFMKVMKLNAVFWVIIPCGLEENTAPNTLKMEARGTNENCITT
jgi:hypothetical protein